MKKTKILLGVGVVVGAMLGFNGGEAQAALPENFQATQVVGTGLNGPSGFGIAPDSRIFILERTGTIKIYKNGQLLPELFANLPSAATGDRGLIGVAFDPDFSSNHFVYFYYTAASDNLNRLVRFDATTDVGTGQTLIYQTYTPSEHLHVGGTVAFGPDGKLYLAVGDNGVPTNAQNLSNAHGKILRLNKDGSAPEDNPFVGQSGKLPEIWAYGFRNPWRFQFDRQTGRLYGGDVGESTYEEINEIVRGQNYGWPICEGYCNNPNYKEPLYAYSHAGFASSAVTAGPIYRDTMFPESFWGNFFFADYGQGFIRRAVLRPDGTISSVESFDDGAGSVVDLHTAPDGSLYYLTYYPGRLYRITYNVDNHVPVANSSSDVTKGIEPLIVQFSSEGSYDPDGDQLTYAWTFGDGSGSSEANPTKTYAKKGTYTVELRVSDGLHTAQAVPIVIQVGQAPRVILAEPLDGSLFNAGDTITYSGSGTDGAGLDLPDSAFTTEVIFHHHDHIHPFLGPVQAKNGSFVIPRTGEPDPDVWYEIRLTATDTNGLSTTAAANIYPRKVWITLDSNPTDFSLTLDGTPHEAYYVFEAVVGFKRTLGAPNGVKGGFDYIFDNWSDGGAQTHDIIIPDKNTTITATYLRGSPLPAPDPTPPPSPAPNPTLPPPPQPTPPPPVPSCNLAGQGSFTACFYNNMDMTNFAATRTDTKLNFDWGYGSPDSAIHPDTFSATWTGSFEFTGGQYAFTVTADDGVRLYLDGERILDKWVNQIPTTYSIVRTVSQGAHTVTMEYYEDRGLAIAQLAWDAAGPAATTPCNVKAFESFTACYYNNKDFSEFAFTRTDTQVNFDWGTASPGGNMDREEYSVWWEGNFSFDNGIYKFTVTADDGVRLYIDSTLVLDKWRDQSSSTYTISRPLLSGTHTVRLEYYENWGNATAKLLWKKSL